MAHLDINGHTFDWQRVGFVGFAVIVDSAIAWAQFRAGGLPAAFVIGGFLLTAAALAAAAAPSSEAAISETVS